MTAHRIRAVIRGTVQGVNFRWAAQAEAERLGVVGVVRNRSDGAVEAELEGADETVNAMLAWLQHGPQGASVADVEREDMPTQGDTSFRIID